MHHADIQDACNESAAGLLGKPAAAPVVAHVDQQTRFSLFDDLGKLTFVGVIAKNSAQLPGLSVIVTQDDVRVTRLTFIETLAEIRRKQQSPLVCY